MLTNRHISRFNQEFPMGFPVFLWFPYGFPMGFQPFPRPRHVETHRRRSGWTCTISRWGLRSWPSAGGWLRPEPFFRHISTMFNSGFMGFPGHFMITRRTSRNNRGQHWGFQQKCRLTADFVLFMIS